MRILFLTQILPYPPDSGPKIKTYHVLRYLAGAGHTITLVSFTRSEQEKAHLPALGSYCRGGVYTVPLRRTRLADAWHMLRSLVSRTPFLIARDYVPEMTDLARRLLADAARRDEPYDAVHADQLNMAQYALLAESPASRDRRPILVLDEHNAVWTVVGRLHGVAPSVFRKILLGLEQNKLKAYEGCVCRIFDTVLTVSGKDRHDLYQAMQGWRPMPVIPIGVDTDVLRPVDHCLRSKNILSIGTMFYPPNVDGTLWFGHRVLPLIRREMPDATYTVIGARPPRAVQALGQAPDCRSSVQVHGYVPDLLPYLGQAACIVVPLRSASGMRVKILEAWARGIPVVSTTVGCEGLGAVPGEHLLVGDTPRDFAQAVLTLLRDPGLGQRLSKAGRQLVEARYDWRTTCKGLDAIYPPVVSLPSAPAATHRRRVLLLTQVLPYPPDAGPKLNVYGKLRHLAEQNAVTLVSFVRSKEELACLDGLSPYCEAIYTVPLHRSLLRDLLTYVGSFLGPTPFLIARDGSLAMRQLVEDLLRTRHYDLVHIDQLNMAQFVGAVNGIPRLLDEHNATWTLIDRVYRLAPLGPLKLALYLEMRKMRGYEGHVCHTCDGLIVLSPQDRAALEEVIPAPLPPLETVPVAWDTDQSDPVPRHPQAKGVLSVGTMFYPPNVDGVLWFARKVWPLVRAQVPEAIFWVVGARPPTEVAVLAKDASGIQVTGYVDDVTPYIEQSALTVVPLRAGGGMRWKILEAFVRGIPVVSTTIGAEGFKVANGRELLLADTAEEFADAVVRLLQDRALGDELVAQARRFVQSHHDPRRVYVPLDAMYERLAPRLKRAEI